MFRRTTLLTVGFIGCLVGLALAHKGVQIPLAALAIVGLFALLATRRIVVVSLLVVALLGVCIGLWRGAQYLHSLVPYTALYGQKVSLEAVVLNDGTYGKTKQLSFDVGRVRLADGRGLPGKLQVSGFGLNGVFYGDTVRLSGTLRPSLGAYQGRMSFSQITLVSHHPSFIGEVRRRFAVGLQNALPEPTDAFALGLLVGQRATLPPDIKEALLMVGLTHIIAVSGYNLTIILRASRRLLAQQSKRLSTILSFTLIIIFILITGFSASIVRAAVISSVTIFASYYGRSIKPHLLITLVAAATALVNPIYLWSDAGWYLSFLAFAGVMILSPLIAERLPVRVQQSTVLMITVESLAAEMATLPYLLHTFGQMSLVGLLANTLIAALIPLAMLLSALAGLVGIWLPMLAGWVAWPALVVLTYMLDTAQLLSKLPHVFQKNIALSGAATVELYAVVVFIWLCLYFKKPPKQGIITDKNTGLVPLQERMHIV